MKTKANLKIWVLSAVLGGLLLTPALGLAKEGGMAKHPEWKARMAKELKLNPELEAKFTAVADKYGASRKEIYEALKKNQDELLTAMAAPKPDEAKVKGLVQAIIDGQDKLLTSYKGERDEEMALLTPLEQGRYLNILHQWRQQMYGKQEMKKEEKKGEKKKK